MSQTLTISDMLYTRLEITSQDRGLKSVEQLLEIWQSREDELRCRQEVVRQVDNLRQRLFDKYGEMPDSVALIRADRER